MKTATVRGYSHVAISVTDLDSARAFYIDLLGFEELPRPDFGFPGMWLRVGDLQLHFAIAKQMPAGGDGFPHVALYLPTAAFSSTVDALKAAGVPLLGPPSKRVDFETTEV